MELSKGFSWKRGFNEGKFGRNYLKGYAILHCVLVTYFAEEIIEKEFLVKRKF